MQTWTLEPIANSWILAAIAGTLAALLVLRPHFTNLSNRKRWTISGIRCSIIMMALLLMLRPGCVTTVEKQQTALLVLMADVSRSMQLVHDTGDETRWQRLTRTMDENRQRLESLEAANIEVRAFGFDNRVAPIESEGGFPNLPASPEGGETDIGSNIDEVVRSLRNQRLVAVMLMSDGVQNATEPRIELSQSVRELVELQTPLITVPFGRPADSGQFADVAVKNMPDNYTGFIKNRQTFSATVQSRGFANREVQLRLYVTDPSGEETVVDGKTITFRQQEEQIVETLAFTPESPGQYRVRFVAEPQAGEISPRNNELPAFLTVFDGGLKVLYVTGNDGFEQNYFRRAIASSKDIQLQTLIIRPDTRGGWPSDQIQPYFEDDSIDVFVLSDVDASALYKKGTKENYLKALAQAVTRGKGLIMTGGYHSFGPGGYTDTPLAELLPVQMDELERQGFDEPLRLDMHTEQPFRIVPLGQHFLSSISDGEQDPKEVWKSLPELPGANRLKPKENSQVLLRSEDNDPILVSMSVKGRVLAFAADQTWRWWMGGKQEAHKRFWRQIILWLAFRDTLSNSNVWINLSQRRFEPGALVEFTVGAKDGAGIGVVDANFSVNLVLPDKTIHPILTNASERGQRTAQLDRELLVQPGLYTIEVTADRNGSPLGNGRAEFIVFDQDKEKSIAAADPEQLVRLANQTTEFGGRFASPDEVAFLLDEIIANPPDTKIEIPQKWRLGDTWQDGLAVLLLFVVLLSCEWVLRKKWGMV